MLERSLVAIVPFIIVLTICAVFLGRYLARVFQGQHTFLTPLVGGIERGLLHIFGVRQDEEQTWKQYAVSLLLFNALGLCFLFILQLVQQWLPGNPQHLGAVRLDTAFNTAVSFMTNTNWQSYSGETTMSYLTQMLGMTVQNFLSAATGIAAAIAVIRGFVRRSTNSIGCFWVDMTRSLVYVLLPIALVLSLVLISQGTVQTLRPTLSVTTLEGQIQHIAVGPAASQVAIKHLGTNGGGFFNANSAHPLESPTPLTNFLEMLAELVIAVAMCFTFGRMVGDKRQGWAIFAAMAVVFVSLMAVAVWAEQSGNPALAKLGVDQTASATQAGGNMEGKETRFGVVNSALFASVTTTTSTGAVNSMHDSFTPLGGLVPMALMQLGENIFGGVGSGLYGMLMYVVIAVFVAGLMIGRTPEYLGKKIEAFEIKMACIGVLVPLFTCLLGTAIAVLVDPGKAGVANPGAHGFSEILYAFSSASGNNGSAFAGLSANTPFYNTALGIVMFFARYWIIIPVLALAGSVVTKKRIPAGAGTLPTHTPLFIFFLVGVVIVIGALTFFPALALGPIVEHLVLYGIK